MNGTVSAKISSSNGFDSHGEPIAATSTWSEAKECRYKANMLSNKGRYEDGSFTQSSYEIIVFDTDFVATEIKLFDRKGNVVCTKTVQSIQELETIQRVKIIV